MNLIPLKLLTIIFNEALEESLLEGLDQLGVKSYTLYPVNGSPEGIRINDHAEENLKIQALLNPELAEKVLSHLSEHYFGHYSVVAYLTPAEVLRGSKYT